MSARLHVLMTTDTVGGVFNHTLALATSLRERGAAVSVAVLGPSPRPDQRAALAALDPVAVRELPGRLEWMEDPWDDLRRAGGELLELEREIRPDVIHAGSYFCAQVGLRAPVVLVAHSCVYSWWQAVHGCEPPLEWQRYRRLVADSLAAADAVVAPTRTMLAALRRHYGALPALALAIPNAVALERRPARKEPFVLAAGRMWDPAKNLDALAGAAAILRHPVLIAGDQIDTAVWAQSAPNGGPHPVDALPGTIGARGAAEPRLLGRLPAAELARLRRRAAVFAAPARYEPFGLAILEAAGDGCALVLGDIPSLRETWDGHADFVEPDDHGALAAKLAQLLSDPGRAARSGARARLRAAGLSTPAMASAYGLLYEQLTRVSAVSA